MCIQPPGLPLGRTCSPPSREGAQLRAEAEAPFRSFRLFIFGAGVAGASLATLFGLPGIIGALAGAPNATKSTAEALSDLAINLGSLAVCAYFVRGDLQARGRGLAGRGTCGSTQRWSLIQATTGFQAVVAWAGTMGGTALASHRIGHCPPLPCRLGRSSWRG